VDEKQGNVEGSYRLDRRNGVRLEVRHQLRSLDDDVAEIVPGKFDHSFLIFVEDAAQRSERALRHHRADATVERCRLKSDGGSHGSSKETDISHGNVGASQEPSNDHAGVMLFVKPVRAERPATVSVTSRVIEKDVKVPVVKKFCHRESGNFGFAHSMEVDDRPPWSP
jgi:hypothetical protein